MEKWGEYSTLGKSMRSEVGHEPTILNDSKETGGIGERRNVKLAWG